MHRTLLLCVDIVKRACAVLTKVQEFMEQDKLTQLDNKQIE